MPRSFGSTVGSRLPITVALGLALYACRHTPGIHFLGDDFRLLIRMVDQDVHHFVLTPLTGHAMVLPYLGSLALFHTFGLRSEPFFVSMLLLHLVNVRLVYRISVDVTGKPGWAAFGAAAWGAAPIAWGTVAAFINVGGVLVVTCSLAALRIVSHHRARGERLGCGSATVVSLLLIGAANSFGTGLGAGTAVALMLALDPATGTRAARCIGAATPPLIAAIYGILSWQMSPDLDAPTGLLVAFHALRHRTLGVVQFGRDLFTTGVTDFAIGWLPAVIHPGIATLVVAVIFLAALTPTIADRGHRRDVSWMLAIAFATYGVTALGRSGTYAFGAVALSTALHAHRYHYVATAFLSIALTIALARSASLRATRAVATAWALSQLTALTFAPAPLSNEGAQQYVEEAHRQLARIIAEAPPGSAIRIPNVHPPSVVTAGLFGGEAFPGLAGVHVMTDPRDVIDGHPLEFEEPDRSVRAEFQAPRSRRLSRLLVPPHVVRGARLRCNLSVLRASQHLVERALACETEDLTCPDRERALFDNALDRVSERCQPCVFERGRRFALGDELLAAASGARVLAASDLPPTLPERTGCSDARTRRLAFGLRAFVRCERQALAHEAIDDETCERNAMQALLDRLSRPIPGCPVWTLASATGTLAHRTTKEQAERVLCLGMPSGTVAYTQLH